MTDTQEPGTGEDAARGRLDALFASFDALTPDELGRIGIGRWDEEARQELLDEVEAAAVATGRVALMDDARARVRDSLVHRYSQGTLHPTWIDLNWGLSQGTVADRVAIVEVLSDAAAAAVVADVLNPDTLEALSVPAEQVVGMAHGMVSEGSLGRQLDVPADADLGTSRTRRLAVALLAGIVAAMTLTVLFGLMSAGAALVLAALAGAVVAVVAYRR